MVKNLTLTILMMCTPVYAPRGDWTDADYDRVDAAKERLYSQGKELAESQGGRSVKGLLPRLRDALAMDELSLREILVIQKVSSFYRFSRCAAAIVPAGTSMENFDTYIQEARIQVKAGTLTTLSEPQIEKMIMHNRWGNEANHAGLVASEGDFTMLSVPRGAAAAEAPKAKAAGKRSKRS